MLGITIFTIGLFKKVVIADTVAAWASPVFESADSAIPISFLIGWQGVIAYTLQLYYDFSGYSDMAIGLAKMFNIKLPINFFSPYKSLSIIDFWKRWHITLSKFLRDYLYIPLGGNRKGKLRQYFNLIIVMTLGGLWHGANWNFVIWGLLHGFYLCINHWWKNFTIKFGIAFEGNLNKLACWGLTFFAVIVSWIFFRTQTFSGALNILKSIAGLQGFILPENYENKLGYFSQFISHIGGQFDDSIYEQVSVLPGFKGISILIFVLLSTILLPNIYQLMINEPIALDTYKNLKTTPYPFFLLWKPNFIYSLITAIIFMISIFCFYDFKNSEFLYFQF